MKAWEKAWKKYFDDNALAEGFSSGNWTDDVRRGFEAGWDACLQAVATRLYQPTERKHETGTSDSD